jgi:ABC-type sugar transport system permease subunit
MSVFKQFQHKPLSQLLLACVLSAGSALAQDIDEATDWAYAVGSPPVPGDTVFTLPGAERSFTLDETAWVPVVLGDVWKTTPFVALLLLAGLQNIDQELYEAARIDGAGAWQRFVHVTLPLLRPPLLVALIFRTLDAFRVFDLIFVLTRGGPGTATEPIALYAFSTLLENLRFGYGSALSVIIFGVTFGLALLYIRLLGSDLVRGEA